MTDTIDQPKPKRVRTRRDTPEVEVPADTANPRRVMQTRPKAETPPVEAAEPRRVRNPRRVQNPTPGRMSLFKLKRGRTPSGTPLFAYTCAILHVLNMFEGGKVPKQAIVGFFASPSIIYRHGSQGNLTVESGGNGLISLTPQGTAYFQNRLNGTSSQKVPADVFNEFVTLLRAGTPPKGFDASDVEPFEVSLEA